MINIHGFLPGRLRHEPQTAPTASIGEYLDMEESPSGLFTFATSLYGIESTPTSKGAELFGDSSAGYLHLNGRDTLFYSGSIDPMPVPGSGADLKAGFTHGHARSQSTNHAGPSGLSLPAMSPCDIPPSHSHPHSSGKLKPFNAAGHDVVPPLSVSSSHPEGASTSSSAATSAPHHYSHHLPSLDHSLSKARLKVNRSVHRQHSQDQTLSPISPSASPGLLAPTSRA